MKAALLIIFGIATSGASATVYKCKDASGAVTYSQTKCGDAAQEVNVRSATPLGKYVPYCPIGSAASEAVAEACLDQYRTILNDPRAAYVVGSELRKRQKGGQIRVLLDARGKNKFGAFIPLQVACELTPDGEIDIAGTAEDRDLWSAFQSSGIYDPESFVSTKGCR